MANQARLHWALLEGDPEDGGVIGLEVDRMFLLSCAGESWSAVSQCRDTGDDVVTRTQFASCVNTAVVLAPLLGTLLGVGTSWEWLFDF